MSATQAQAAAPILPVNLDAERAILGAILLDNKLYGQAAEHLTPDDFSLDAHRRIYSRMRDLQETSCPVDMITLAEELNRHKEIDVIGGVAYLSELIDGVCERPSIAHYIKIVRGKALLRRIIRHAEAQIGRSRQPGADPLIIAKQIRELGESLEQDIGADQDWRTLFKSRSQMEQGPLSFLIENILPEGIGFIAGLAFVGKTWFSLSMAKALATGRPFLDRWKVPEVVPVVYLIPEAGEKAFRERLDRLAMPEETFLCRTVKDGPLLLDDVRLHAAVKALRPVVFLDTAIRFSSAKDENSATENQALVQSFCGLLAAGTRAVVGLHHSAKSTASAEEMTLENSLRGTSDLGAMADVVFGLKAIDAETNEIRVRCVKARDFVCPQSFHITGRPYIDEIGDFVITTEPGSLPSAAARRSDERETLADIIANHPWQTQRNIVQAAIGQGILKSRAEEFLKKDGPWQTKSGPRNAILYGPIADCPVSGQSGQSPDSKLSSVQCPTPLGVDTRTLTVDTRALEI